MRVERLPFTVYDIVGYLIPGAFFCLVLVGAGFAHEVPGFLAALKENETRIFLISVGLFGFLVAGYVIGHALALLAAELLERLLTGMIGYPSGFLVDASLRGADSYRQQMAGALNRFARAEPRYSSILMLAFLPFTLVLSFADSFDLADKIIKPMGRRAIELFSTRFHAVFGKAHTELETADWFRLVDFYMASDAESYFLQRQYNYVTLYGFCRNMSFILYLTFIIMGYKSVVLEAGMVGINWPPFWMALAALATSILLFLGFAKYFRRYSQEAILGFVTLSLRDRSPAADG